MTCFAILLAAAAAQEDPARAARKLVEQLRSDQVEEREEAGKKLRGLGPGAVPDLQEAAKSADRELASRAARLLRVIAVEAQLSPELRKAVPGLVERLADGDDHTWTNAYLELTDREKHPRLSRRHTAALAARAVRGAPTDIEAARVCETAAQLGHRSAALEIARLLDEDLGHPGAGSDPGPSPGRGAQVLDRVASRGTAEGTAVTKGRPSESNE